MTIIIKPTYSCNFRCKYCYLGNNTKSAYCHIDVDFVKNFIIQVRDFMIRNHRDKVSFIWHGGEPLLWGLPNYRKIFSFMEKNLTDINYRNLLQTNLSLINNDFIDLFSQYNIHVGFSIDGPKDITDSQRIDLNGAGTFDSVMEKVKLCKERGIKLGCIVVGTKKHIDRIPQLYDFLCKQELNFKFNPIFSSGEASCNYNRIGISPEEYAQMEIELFDLWFYDKRNHIKESNLEEIAANIIIKRPTSCVFSSNCQDNFFALTPTGDIMPCGRFCGHESEQYSYGNLHVNKLSDILTNIRTSEAYRRTEYIHQSSCRLCKYYNLCHGGCLHDGFLQSGDFKSKTYLCPAYKKIFSHIEHRLTETINRPL